VLWVSVVLKRYAALGIEIRTTSVVACDITTRSVAEIPLEQVGTWVPMVICPQRYEMYIHCKIHIRDEHQNFRPFHHHVHDILQTSTTHTKFDEVSGVDPGTSQCNRKGTKNLRRDLCNDKADL